MLREECFGRSGGYIDKFQTKIFIFVPKLLVNLARYLQTDFEFEKLTIIIVKR